ncbi:MAG: hypothetical protein AB7P14_09185 [Blastocatellales bacterium]
MSSPNSDENATSKQFADDSKLDELDVEEEIEDDDEELDDDDWDYEPDEDDLRVMAIFGATDHPPDVSAETLEVYRTYLLQHLVLPCRVTGREDFPWEERFFYGYGSKQEYRELKKTNPSYEDHFDLLGLGEDPDEDDDILAKVRRVSDKKQFVIGLDWLETVTEKSPNYQFLEDYATWYVNHR